MRKKIILLMLIPLLFTCGFNLNKAVEFHRAGIKVPVRSYRVNAQGGHIEYFLISHCIEYGIVAEGMTLRECNLAVKGEFKLLCNLTSEWSVFTYKDANIFFKNKVVGTMVQFQLEEIKVLDTLEKTE